MLHACQGSLRQPKHAQPTCSADGAWLMTARLTADGGCMLHIAARLMPPGSCCSAHAAQLILLGTSCMAHIALSSPNPMVCSAQDKSATTAQQPSNSTAQATRPTHTRAATAARPTAGPPAVVRLVGARLDTLQLGQRLNEARKEDRALLRRMRQRQSRERELWAHMAGTQGRVSEAHAQAVKVCMYAGAPLRSKQTRSTMGDVAVLGVTSTSLSTMALAALLEHPQSQSSTLHMCSIAGSEQGTGRAGKQGWARRAGSAQGNGRLTIWAPCAPLNGLHKKPFFGYFVKAH
jgi:hypothetical protein